MKIKNRIIIIVLLFFMVTVAFLTYIAATMTIFSLKKDVFIFEYGTQIPTEVDYYVNASKRVSQSVVLNLKNVENKVGTYKATASYLDEELHFTIKIVDNTKPKVTLKQVVFRVTKGAQLYAKDTIGHIEDASLTNVYFQSADDSKDLTKYKRYKKYGTYIERVVVIDNNGNESAPLRVKIVVVRNTEPPVIKGINNIKIAVNSSFDPLSGVSAYDAVDGDITKKIEVIGSVDTSHPAVYTLRYRVVDSSENETIKTRKVIVE